MKQKQTWNQFARATLPEVPKTRRGDDFLGYVLWNETAFPFADPASVRQQLEEFRALCTAGVRPAYGAWRKSWRDFQRLVKLPYDQRAAFAEKLNRHPAQQDAQP